MATTTGRQHGAAAAAAAAGGSGGGGSGGGGWKIDDFEFGPPVGKGRFGNVYNGRDKASGREVAIKVLLKEQLEQNDLVSHLRREVETHCRLRHANVVRCYGYFQDEHRVFVVMAFAGGGDLRRYLGEQPGRRLPDAQAAFYVRQLLLALDYLHEQGIMHRDLKPENVLLSATDGRLLLADFGWCTSLKRLRQTICGTQGAYLAPEMLRHEPYGPAVDLWTAGVIAHELLTGRTPAAASDGDDEGDEGQGQGLLRSLPDGVSAAARDFLARVLVEDQHARPSLKAALQHPWLDPARVRPPAALPRRLVAAVPASSRAAAGAAASDAGAAGAPPPPARRLAIPSAEEQQQQQQQQPEQQPQQPQKKAWCITDFEIGRPIGRGRYGSVYMARCKRSQRIVALKVLFKDQLEADGVMHQVRNEVEIHCRIQHPHIVACHGYFHDAHRLFLVMEYAPSELYKTLQKAPGGRFDEPTAAKYARQLIDALGFLHANSYIHRDLKPENLLLSPSRGLKLCDFGWSISAGGPGGGDSNSRLRKTLCGTPDYIAPEMLRNEPYFESVDCWAVGVLAYEFLVGHTPFRPPPASSPYSSPNKLNAKHASASPYAADPEQNQLYNSILNSVVSFPPHVSPEARDFISRLLERNPRRRMRLREAFAHRWIRQHAAAAAAAGGVQMPAAAGAVAAAPRE